MAKDDPSVTTRTGVFRPPLARRAFKKGAHIFAGSMIQGFAMAVFLFPHSIPSGGGAGIAVLLNYGLGIPMSLGLWAANIAFLLFGIHYLGNVSAIGTVMVITLTSASVNVFDALADSPFQNVWIDLLCGSLLLGAGIAILMRERFSNGGIGFVALAIAKTRGVNPGRTLFGLNGLIFAVTAYVIDWHIIFQALICQWISTRLVGLLYGLSFRRRILAFPRGGRKKR